MLDFIGDITIDEIDLGDPGYLNDDVLEVSENSNAKFDVTPDADNNGFNV